MKIISRLFLVMLVLGAFSSVNGQNRITINLDDFNSLSVSGGIDLELIPSDSREMSITALNGKPEEVGVDMKDGELTIRIRPRIEKEDITKVKLPYSKLNKISVSAGAVVNSARDLQADDLQLTANSGGKIELGVNAKNIDAKVIQVSDIILYGKAVSQNVNANTGGNYLAYDLECQDTYIKVSSGSQGKVTASRIIEATAFSKGFIGYIGDPVSTYTKTSMGGEIAAFKTRQDADNY